MSLMQNSNYERYLIYPNESIDKVTVNRTFERLFEDIDAKTVDSSLKVDSATDKSYGKAKFSKIGEYLFDEPENGSEHAQDYSGSMLTIWHLKNMSDRLFAKSDNSLYVSPLTSGESETVEPSSYRYWVKSEYSDSKFIFMPNGVNVFTFRFDIGFNGLSDALGSDSIIDEDIISPISLSGYRNDINIDSESMWNIQDFINDRVSTSDYTDAENVKTLVDMDGRSITVPFLEGVKVTLRHNDCSSTEYSAYRQSYVEVCMSMKISVKSLLESKYGLDEYDVINGDSSVAGFMNSKNGDIGRGYRLFTQKPLVMSQISFFNNSSNPSPLFGFDNRLEGDELKYVTFNPLSAMNVLIDDESVVGIDSTSYKISGKTFEYVENDRGTVERHVIYDDWDEVDGTPTIYFSSLPVSGIVEERQTSFSSHSRLSQKPLDEDDVDGNMVSPVNGNVLVKKVENVYDSDGNIIDNRLLVDVIMKFMAGSQSDPEMEYAMKTLNSRSRVQFAMIGV